VDHVDGFPRDATLLSDLPKEVTIHRASCGGALNRMRRVLRALDGHGITSGLARAIGWRLDSRLEQSVFPDSYASWARASVRPLCRLIGNEGIDAIYTTFSPVSNHLVGLALKRKTSLPWVADFRDLWTDDFRYREASAARRNADRRLEQEILETADAVVGVTDDQTDILANHLPSARDKFTTITNGFDPTDLPDKDLPRNGRDAFVLAYVGRLDRWRASSALFDGLQRFGRYLGEDRRRFMLRLAGHASPDTRAKIDATGIRCEFAGYVSHADALREIGSADALLLIGEGRSRPDRAHAGSSIPGKLFEYLASRRPILSAGQPGGECERIVKSCEAGLAVAFNGEVIAEALKRLYEAWRAGRPLPGCRPDCLEQYNRVELTRRLASVLDKLLSARTGSRPVQGAPLGVGA
jgi:glycosyltransferase involved in cell wall biosynthesis